MLQGNLTGSASRMQAEGTFEMPLEDGPQTERVVGQLPLVKKSVIHTNLVPPKKTVPQTFEF